MARCRRCGKDGLFLKLNKDGYCEYCQQQIEDEKIERHNQEMKHAAAVAAARGQQVAQPTNEAVRPEYTMACIGGATLYCYKNRLTLVAGKTEADFPFSSIQSFTITELAFGRGRITIKTSEAPIGAINFGMGISGVVGSEQNMTVAEQELITARKIRDYIDEAKFPSAPQPVQAAPAISAPQTSSAADEIRKFKSLLDDGIITQEEFNAKKKQLLGL